MVRGGRAAPPPSLVVLTLLGDDVDGDLFWRVFALRRRRAARCRNPPRAGPAAAPPLDPLASSRRLPGYETLAERSQLFALVRTAVTRAWSHASGRPRWARRPATAEEVRRFREEGLALLAAELRWLDERMREDGARPGGGVRPVPRERLSGERVVAGRAALEDRSAVAEAAAEACREMACRFRDLTPALVAPGPGRAGARCTTKASRRIPRPPGYRAIAEEVAAVVRCSERPAWRLDRFPTLERPRHEVSPRH